tara:strand:+ start:74 stop:256 length:183 start_codon:yes stop_codon:yes gene_type:complete
MFHQSLLLLVILVEVQTTQDVVVTETHHHLEVTVVHQVVTEQTVVNSTQEVSVEMVLAVT